MGIFDKMFGSGATAAAKAPDAQQHFEALKRKYAGALRAIEDQQVRLLNLHVENGKLVVRGVAPSQQAKNVVWDQIKLANPSFDDVTADIEVRQDASQGAAGGPAPARPIETYEVKKGDTLSKISKQFYGDANEYMRIFYANQDKLKDPDKIQIGQKLTIPMESV